VKIHILRHGNNIYSSNAYLLRGSNNRIGDLNTLIDTGTDCSIIDEIANINTGVGKKTIYQILLTHNHFDHTGCISEIKKRWNPKLLAFSKQTGADKVLKHNDVIKAADSWCQIIHIPEHSSDSVCFFFPEEEALFSGDTPVRVQTTDITFNEENLQRMEELSRMKISRIYPGHGNVIENGTAVLKKSLRMMHEHVRQTRK
jgi:glyoxylase-like metal-dependent hydrolase (beta-lactamase superfamily II)